MKNLYFFWLFSIAILFYSCSNFQTVKPESQKVSIDQRLSGLSVLEAATRVWDTETLECYSSSPSNCLDDVVITPKKRKRPKFLALYGTTGSDAAANLVDLYPIFEGTTELLGVSSGTLTVYVETTLSKEYCYLVPTGSPASLSNATAILPTVFVD